MSSLKTFSAQLTLDEFGRTSLQQQWIAEMKLKTGIRGSLAADKFFDARGIIPRMMNTMPNLRFGQLYRGLYYRESFDICWEWAGSLRPDGYGRARRVNGTEVNIHRKVWELLAGPRRTLWASTKRLHVDHMCHFSNECEKKGKNCLHRRCINPLHLALVTASENRKRTRPTHCPRCKLILDGDNLRLSQNQNGYYIRVCKNCERNKWMAYR